MLHGSTKFFSIAILLTLAACNVVGTQYVYAPLSKEERPATINSRVNVYSDTQVTLITREPELLVSVIVGKVGDKFFRTGFGSLLEDENDTRYKLSPGKQKIGLTVSIPPALTAVTLALDAKPGETYTLGAAAYPATNNYNVWVQDSAGNRVVGTQLGLKKTYSTVLIPGK